MEIGRIKHFTVFLILLIFQNILIFLIHGVVNGVDDLSVKEATFPAEAQTILSSCRYGAAVSDLAEINWLDDLGAGWYFSFNESIDPAPNFAEFVPMISIGQDKTIDGQYLPTYSVNPPLTDARLGQLVNDRPGSLWVIGNEVDRGPNPGDITGGQGDTFPEIYAQGYHEIYYFIKQRDPTAKIAISGLVEVTPGRLQYLDLMWEEYRSNFGAAMPVDVWNMHLYILPEVKPNGQPNGVANVALGTDPGLGRKESGGLTSLCPLESVYCVAEHDDLDVFEEQIVDMRQWMKDHGQQNKPLILSEFSILYPYSNVGGNCSLKDEFGNCFTPQRVTNFLNTTFDYLYNKVDPSLGYSKDGYRLVQQSLWFSVNNQSGVGAASDLVRNNALTQAGQAFTNYVQNIPATINLFVDGVNSPVVETGGSSTVSATLSVMMRNNGNIAPNSNFFVTFYRDPGLDIPIGTATITSPGPDNPGMVGCARFVRTVLIVWNNLTPGIHPFWVKIDSNNDILETIESDNTGRGIVIVNGKNIFLPVTVR